MRNRDKKYSAFSLRLPVFPGSTSLLHSQLLYLPLPQAAQAGLWGRIASAAVCDSLSLQLFPSHAFLLLQHGALSTGCSFWQENLL